MATILDSSDDKVRKSLSGMMQLGMYCSLDSCITAEVFRELHPQLRAKPTLTPFGPRYLEEETYAFARAMQAPIMEMMQAGIRIDEYARGNMIAALAKENIKLRARLQKLLIEGLELDPEKYPFVLDFNPQSISPPTTNQPNGGHVQRLFYEILGLPIVKSETGKPSVDRDALEKFERYPSAKPFIGILLALRDIKGILEVLRVEIDDDGRIRTSLGIAATKTGRMASYAAGNGKGRNLQNIDPQLRHIFTADKGRRFAYIDLEQAEARLVGAIVWVLFGDPTYLDACESSDLHTAVSAMTWPHIKTREDADQIFYRNFSYRFTSKKLGHGSSYYGKARRLSQETTIPVPEVEAFQEKFFRAFPGIRMWHTWVSQQLATQGFLVSMMARKRWFMGRADDDSTLREAIAYDPQNSIAELLNRGLFRLWFKSRTDATKFPIRCLLQIHDAVLIDYPEDVDETILLPRLIKTLETEIVIRHKDLRRKLIIPAAAQVGWNWGHSDKENIDGLVDFDGRTDTRKRQMDPTRSVLG